jgi:hypothetical protein
MLKRQPCHLGRRGRGEGCFLLVFGKDRPCESGKRPSSAWGQAAVGRCAARLTVQLRAWWTGIATSCPSDTADGIAPQAGSSSDSWSIAVSPPSFLGRRICRRSSRPHLPVRREPGIPSAAAPRAVSHPVPAIGARAVRCGEPVGRCRVSRRTVATATITSVDEPTGRAWAVRCLAPVGGRSLWMKRFPGSHAARRGMERDDHTIEWTSGC